MGGDAASQVARLLLMASLPEANGAVKGLTQAPDRREPRRAASVGDRVRRRVREAARRVLVSAPARQRRLGLSTATKTCARRSRSTPTAPRSRRSTPRCSGGCWRSSKPRRKIAYSEVLALPKVEDIKTRGGRLLLVLSPDKKVPPEDAEAPVRRASSEKNNFCILTGDGSDLAKLEDKVRRIWAVAKVKDEDGGDKSPNARGTQRGSRAGRIRVQFDPDRRCSTASTTRAASQGRRRAAVGRPEDDADQGEGRQVRTSIDGETAVEEALAVDRRLEALSRGQRRERRRPADPRRGRCCGSPAATGGRDGRTSRSRRSATSAGRGCRSKGLDEIRKRAINTGEWRDNGDGYIEKGPFPPAKTSVKAVTANARRRTGKATIDLTASTAATSRRSTSRETEDVSASSPAGPGRHVRERRDGALVPRGRSRRQA